MCIIQSYRPPWSVPLAVHRSVSANPDNFEPALYEVFCRVPRRRAPDVEDAKAAGAQLGLVEALGDAGVGGEVHVTAARRKPEAVAGRPPHVLHTPRPAQTQHKKSMKLTTRHCHLARPRFCSSQGRQHSSETQQYVKLTHMYTQYPCWSHRICVKLGRAKRAAPCATQHLHFHSVLNEPCRAERARKHVLFQQLRQISGKP